MNIDRRTFLNSSAGAIVAAHLPELPACEHDWNPGTRCCNLCGLTQERLFFGPPINPQVFRNGDVLMMSLAAYADLSQATRIEPKKPEEKRGWLIPAAAIKWTRSRTK